MSIWNDCQEFNAVPFYGFPVKPTFSRGFINFQFPLGYEPNGSKTKEVAKAIIKHCGKKHKDNIITSKRVKIKLDNTKLAYLVYAKILKEGV